MVFDTETTGLPKTKIINPDTLDLWPHIVQFSYIIYDTELNNIEDYSDSIVKLEGGISISEDSIKIHGITNESSQKNGIYLDVILEKFFYHLRNVDLLVGHNVSFDINMIKIELLRLLYENNLNISKNDIKVYKYNLHLLTNYNNICCTLKDSINLCNIKATNKFGREYVKFPSLLELHQKLFESIPNNLHNSLNDILVTLRCFMKLKYNIDLNETCRKFKKLSKQINLF